MQMVIPIYAPSRMFSPGSSVSSCFSKFRCVCYNHAEMVAHLYSTSFRPNMCFHRWKQPSCVVFCFIVNYNFINIAEKTLQQRQVNDYQMSLAVRSAKDLTSDGKYSHVLLVVLITLALSGKTRLLASPRPTAF